MDPSQGPAGLTGDAHPVVIAGGGPVGLTLALALARQGIRSLVLEEDATVSDGSRALGMSRRTQDIWASAGAGEAVEAKGLPWFGGWTYFRQQLVLQHSLPHDPALRHPPMLNLQQCDAEQFLVDAAGRTGLVDLRWNTSLAGVTQDEDGVWLDVAGPGRLRAAYAVACDGAGSRVRSSLGLRMEGASGEARYLIVDVRIAQDLQPGRRAWFDSPSNPGATVLMHGQPDRVWRIDWQVGRDDDPSVITAPANVAARVAQHLGMLGVAGPWEVIWISTYRAHARTLPAYRIGRVMLAGDAAHLIPIFGIRGLNSGVEDAWNLAWKLAMVLRGEAPDALLDSYSAERVGAARENLRLATRALNFMTPPTPGRRLLRDAVLSLALSQPAVRDLINPRQATLVPLAGSTLNTPVGEGKAIAGLQPGDVVPNLRLLVRNGADWVEGSLHALLGPGFTLVWLGQAAGAAGLRRQLQHLTGLRLVVIATGSADTGADALAPAGDGTILPASRPRALVLVRPDDHIAGCWLDADAGSVEAALAVATARVRMPEPALPSELASVL